MELTSSLFVLEGERLRALAKHRTAAYASARPFPHAVIDDFLPADALGRVLDEFPPPGSIDWIRFSDPAQKKLASRTEEQMGTSTRLLLHELNSAVFLEFLEELTGIDGLMGDPYYGGGGLHQIEAGGFLKIHADFNRHTKLRLDRRVNVLLYLNRNWDPEYGGELELWNEGMTRAEQRILPVFNRCVVFNTTDVAYHGHPDPLRCPPGWTRKSIALYYYTSGRPAEEESPAHNTLFQRRPGERGCGEDGLMAKASRAVQRVTPPVLFDAWRRLRRGGGSR